VDELPEKPRSLYLHVPFCARRCSYCDFAVEATSRAPTDEWLESVSAEMRLLAEERGWDEPLALDTIYVGGGTPSLLDAGAMRALRERLAPHAVWDPDRVEWTAEANPESFTAATADDWREAGVNRISLGVQTFHPEALRWMGRLHGPDGPRQAMGSARAAGFENVSIDLIFGLPERLGRDWDDDLSRAIELAPDHVSLYGLTAEPAAPLGRWVEEGREALAGEESYAEQFLLAHERLVAAGFEHYEVSNFGRPGRRSRHNFVYWSGAPYAALGPGAHAYFPPVRRWNLRSWTSYRDATAAGTLPLDSLEVVEPEAAGLERVWLLLRTDRGLPLEDAAARQRTLAREWAERGLASIEGGRVRLTAHGWLLLDSLAVRMYEAAESRRAAPGGAPVD
jgi:oxygen-independent coproporphyrinogen III oxidase